MPDIIKLLPDSIANQIAAGEVIQRPASVVKELMENGLDAGADTIQVIVKDAGKSLIQVVDNGMGMSETDARMSFERHATSKIRGADDLFAIRSMGFRGEALASIAAVAQVELRTKQESEKLGTRILIDGSTVIAHEPFQTTQGTSLGVKNLFFNIPARRKFLKSDPVEFKHIMDEFSRIALAHPEIAFSLFHNDSEVVILQKSNVRQRIVNLLGRKYNEQLVPVSEQTDYVEITGFVGKPETAKKTRGDQFLFVNRRYIKSPYLHHAVRAAYEEMISEDVHPMYVIYLEVDPARIDINVHPTKQEIKFEDERLIYNYLRVSIRHALGKYSVTPSLDFEQEQAFSGVVSREYNLPSDHPAPARMDTRTADNLQNWQMLYEGLSQSQSATSQSTLIPETNGAENKTPLDSLQVHGTFIVAQTKSGMLVVDQQAAHQRILFERYLALMQRGSADTQKTLFPQTLELSPVEAKVFTTILPEVNSMGFDVQDFGGNSFIIHGIPTLLKDENPAAVLHRLISEYLEDTGEGTGLTENVARAMSLSSAIRHGVQMAGPERLHLIENLFACENPYTSPSGRRCFVLLSIEALSSIIQNLIGFFAFFGNMFQITDVIKHLLIINLIVFFGAMIMQETGVLDETILSFHYPLSVHFKPYQIVTHMFMHGSVAHLFFNMLALVMLGPYVEHYLGSKRFLALYLISGFGALGLHLLIWYFQLSAVPAAEFAALMQERTYGVVGASGALYGVLAAFAFLFPNTRLMLLFPPIPIKAKYLVAGLIAFDLLSGISGTSTGVAHFAHIGGALFGFITLLFWRKANFK